MSRRTAADAATIIACTCDEISARLTDAEMPTDAVSLAQLRAAVGSALALRETVARVLGEEAPIEVHPGGVVVTRG